MASVSGRARSNRAAVAPSEFQFGALWFIHTFLTVLVEMKKIVNG